MNFRRHMPKTLADSMIKNTFQRKGASSNAAVGTDFELLAQSYFASIGLVLERNVAVEIGLHQTRPRLFDLGCRQENVLVECKSHKWTESARVPSAKLTTWDQAMFFFEAAPDGFRKIFFVLRHHCERRDETLAAYYIRTHFHLIPADVEMWEYDTETSTATKLIV